MLRGSASAAPYDLMLAGPVHLLCTPRPRQTIAERETRPGSNGPFLRAARVGGESSEVLKLDHRRDDGARNEHRRHGVPSVSSGRAIGRRLEKGTNSGGDPATGERHGATTSFVNGKRSFREGACDQGTVADVARRFFVGPPLSCVPHEASKGPQHRK